MNRIIFTVAFAIGLWVVAWVGMGFVGTSALALAMTMLIAGVYIVGAWEVHKFRATTASLAAALADAPQPVAELGAWLERVPAALRNAVRLRVEGERSALPGLALTPYLVGLLVMLGMLGTFLGMVVTFKGAVFALEGSTDLQAIRTALAAPIKGLGLSFGTSIAGVAASAMLGLLSAMSRRERLDVVRVLDTRIATVLRPFSLAHQRQETFKALQTQADALPNVVDRLQTMMEGLERRSQQLNEQLLGQQAQFHREASLAYTGLADAVGGSLQDSLVAGARAAGESIKPVVESAMAEMAQASSHMHQRVFEATQTQLNGLINSFGSATRAVSDGWATALQQHARTSESQVEQLNKALQAFNGSFEQRAQALLVAVQDAALASRADLAAADQQRLQAWTQTLQTTATTLHGEWQQAGAQTLAQQQAVCTTLEKTAGEVMARTSQSAGQALAQVGQLLTQSEALLHAHTEAEARWTSQQGERLDQLAGLWRSELAALRSEEATRGEAAVARVGEMQTELTAQLSHRVEEVLARTGQQAGQTLEQVANVLAQSETLVQAHTEAEVRWTSQQGERLDQLAGLWRSELAALRSEETARGEAAAQRLGELHTTLTERLAQDASEVLQRASQQGRQTLEQLAQLVTGAEALVSSRTESETRWTQQQGERLDQLANLWRSELGALRTEEAARGEAAVARLSELQTAVTTHLATLGTALEAPMTRLMETAAAAPQAAAEVIAQLRQEMGHITARDNLALAERASLVESIGTLLQSLNQASAEQRAAIDSLVAAASQALDQAGGQFAQALDAQAEKTADVAAQVAGSAIELASLGESFGHGVQLFSAANEKLVEGLQRMEGAMQQSSARSDEQLAYYVAQAREVIDLSIASQQQVVEDLRRLRNPPANSVVLPVVSEGRAA